MRPIRRHYDIAGAFVMLSGLFHLPLFWLEGLSPRTKALFVIGILWIVMGLLLRRRHRWLAYVAFIAMLIGVVASIASFSTGIWMWYLIFLMDLLAAIFLFRILWANNPAG